MPLYIVATPIGNLEDITFRAVETLKKVDLIVCEDTRVSKKLLDHYQVNTNTTSFYRQGHGGSQKPLPKFDYLIEELKAGKNLAFITDAGTPGISDPGNQLVEKAIENGICVIPIPGASSLTTLASVSGIDLTRFIFLGFPPHKKGRETFFREVGEKVNEGFPVMFFESCHRILKSLGSLSGFRVILGRELTKMFEEIVRGNAEEVREYFEKNTGKVKGEIVIIAYKILK